MIGGSDDKISFPHELWSTNRKFANLRKAFASYLATDIKLSKTRLSKRTQSGGFLGRLIGPLLKTGLPLLKNVNKSLAKSVLTLFGLTAAASAEDAGIHKKLLRSDHHPSNSASHNKTILIISNEMMKWKTLLK